MIKSVRWAAAIIVFVCGSFLVHNPAALAGSFCKERKIGPEEIQKAMQIAYKTRRVLEDAGATVALVGRVGSDLSEYGLRYTHMGLIMRDHPAGKWSFVHLLNVCATDTSEIYDEGLVNFFLDDLFVFEAVVVIPSLRIQKRFTGVLRGPLVLGMHESKYSMIANPFSLKYQNSNQWLLEMIAAAVSDEGTVRTRRDAQRFLMATNYLPDTIMVADIQRFGAAFLRANVRFDDHDELEVANHQFRTVSVRSVVRYLDHIDKPILKVVVSLDRSNQTPTIY